MKKLILLLILLMLPIIGKSQSGPLTGTISFQIGTSLPTTCDPSPVLIFYLYSGGTYTGYNCTAINTWTASGGGPTTFLTPNGLAIQVWGMQTNSIQGWVSPQSVNVSDPPYNAKCDGVTDDHIGLQKAFNSGAGIINLPLSLSISPFTQYLCSTSVPLTLPGELVLQFNASGIYYTGNSGVGLTATTGDLLLNGYIQTNSSTGTFTTLQLGPDSTTVNINIFDLVAPPLTYTALKEEVVSYSSIQSVNTDGPVVIDAGGNPYQFAANISSSGFGPSATAFPSMLIINGSSPILNLNSVLIDMTGTPSLSTAAAIDFVAPSSTTNFNNVSVVSTGSYTGNVFKIDSGSQNLTGIIDTTQYAAGGLSSGTWTGSLLYKNTTYRGSAATLTYRCNGGTQAGLIYTNNSSCTGGTAVATGDSVQ